MAELNPEAKRRIEEAKRRAAARLGVDVSQFSAPRSGGEEAASASGQEAPAAAAVARPAEAAPAESVARAGDGEETVVAVAVGEATAQTAEAESKPAAEKQADRVATARARAAARAGAAPAEKPAAPRPAATRPAPVEVTRPAAPARPSTDGAQAPAMGQEGMNRREFLSYAWGAALGLMALEGGVATYFFMYPRFRAGEFGGKFELGTASALPAQGAKPTGNPTGKFWLVNTQEGPNAFYMVCTHLGCLYKWEEARGRFECPCHGSKFTREGFYIEGPAPRSLDQFVLEVVENGEVVARTEDDGKNIVPPKIAGTDAQLYVDTGKRILGKPAAESPAFHQG